MSDRPGATTELSVAAADGVELAGEESSPARPGEGAPIVLLHGLTATRRYVVMGSRMLERSGFRVIGYDARGHGRSSAAPDPAAYDYDDLARDLEAVLDALGLERAILAGASMGAHTALRFALRNPARVAGLGLITPSFDPERPPDAETLANWDALAEGLRERGVEGFVDAYDFSGLPGGWRDTVERVVRQRLAAHEHPEAVADALEVVPRSRPFERIADLSGIEAPTVVVASRDEADPGHPLAVGERYARTIPSRKARRRGSGPIAPIADRVAGRAALAGAGRAHGPYVITYTRMQARDWDGASYDRISAPQEALGRAVLARMDLRGDETVLDAGCGSGRVTEALLERLPRGRVIAVDASPSMVEQARRRLGDRAVEIRQMDLLELELAQPVDAILSTATFHWVLDHAALFAPSARRAAPRRPARRPVRGRGQHRPSCAGSPGRCWSASHTRSTSATGAAPWYYAAPRAHARASARGRLHRGGVLACAGAAIPRAAARVPRQGDPRAPRAETARRPAGPVS